MGEALYLQWVAGTSRGGKFEYLFTWRLVLGLKATLFDTGGSAQTIWGGFHI
jgi:hypothetical protein